MAVPALGALAADPLLSLVDTAFVARLGTRALGALGVDTAIFSFAFFVFNFLAFATTPMVARRIGRGDHHGAGRVVVQALTLAIPLGVGTALVLVVAAEPIVRLMQASPELVEPAVSYLRIRALAMPAVLVVIVGHGAFRGFQDTKTPLMVAAVVNGINLVLDPLLIFGLDLGLEGAAAATVIAQYIGAVWFLRLLSARGRKLGWSWTLPRPAELFPMLRTGGVLTLRTLFLIVTLTVATAVAASMGVAEVAAHQVVQQTWFLLALTVDALAIAAQAIVANELGRSDRAAAAAVAARLWRWGLGLGTMLGGVLYLARSPLVALFAPDPTVAALIMSAMLVAALMQPVAGLVFVADGIFLGLLQVRYLAYSTAAGAGVGGLILWLTVDSGWGLEGVWWAIAAMVTARLAVLLVAYPSALARASGET